MFFLDLKSRGSNFFTDSKNKANIKMSVRYKVGDR